MSVIDKLAEQKMLASIERGALNELPGQSKPLQLVDDSAVPEEVRAGYRILKNAAYLPVELRRASDRNLPGILMVATAISCRQIPVNGQP